MGSYFWEQYHFDYIFVILIRENSRFGTTPRILLSITDPTHNWLLAPAPPSVETPGTGCVMKRHKALHKADFIFHHVHEEKLPVSDQEQNL